MRPSPAMSLKRSSKVMKTMMMGLTLGFSLSAFARTEKTPEQYWREADMRLDYLLSEYFVSSHNCQLNFKNFQACADALNAIASKADPALEVLPSSVLKDPAVNAGAERLKLPSGFVITEAPVRSPEKLSLRILQERRQARLGAIEKGEQELYAMVEKVGAVDFPSDVKTVLNEAKIKPENIPAAAASAVSAYVAGAVDSHARLEPVAKMDDESNDANNEFFGIGATLRMVDDRAVIQQVLAKSPAFKYGLETNDIITEVNGTSVEKMDLVDVVKMIRGPENTKIRLLVRRKGEPKELAVVRGKVVVQNVEVNVKEMLGAKYIVVRLASFIDKFACDNIEAKVAEESAKDPSIAGVIVDVRNNGGGLLQQAVCIGSLFVGEKTIVKVKDLTRESFEDYDGPRSQVTKLPMVTLINANSASASEILSGALQDYGRSWIVGERSFGKGSVQAPMKLTDKIYMYKTISRFYQPSGRTNQIVGILPDFEVPARPNLSADERYALHEGDIFPNALEAMGEPWIQPRPEAVARIQKCRAENGRAELAYKLSDVADYQLLVGAEVLSCDKEATRATSL